MRKSFDLPFGIIILVTSFCFGGLLGVCFSRLISGITLSDYFLSYFSAIEQGSVTSNLFSSIWINLKTPFLTFFLGFTFLGVIILPLLFVVEGFIFTFSISTLCRLLGISGFIPSFFLFCIPTLLWIPLVFMLGLESFYASLLLIGRGKNEEAYPKYYFFRSFFCLTGILFRVLFECFFLPIIMQGIV